MDILQKTDEAIFRWINIDLANPLTDKLMPFITERNNWFIFYGLIWIYLFFKGGAKGKVSAVMILLLILVCDQFSDNVIKLFFQRIRPCHTIPGVHLLVGCSDAYSFPSIHAVNNFAAATLFSYFYKDMKYFLFTGAFLVSISRIFCGVHYPFDMIGGALIGMFFAFVFIFLWKKLNARLKLF
ncbi:MAG TPA: phosphatase PAP2 family protein [Ignavibacteria bacterium]|nr:phosphatase PAP2 family protein [Ignavibacteria bacterium]